MNRIKDLFRIQYPVIQAGMIWCSGWKLASAVSNAGGLGLIGAGSMHPEVLSEHILKCKKATDKPFGVNIPLLYPQIDEIIRIVCDNSVKIVFTSAGSPKKYTSFLKNKGIIVAHVVASSKNAKKCEEAGVDAVVAEGFEAGGHNGAEETTTMALIPSVRKAIKLPLIAAGGIASGAGVLAAFALGAEGVQIGSRFAVSVESSAHIGFKNKIIQSSEGDTKLMLKKLGPVRLLKNKFFDSVKQAEESCATESELKELLGQGRAKKGMFEGELEEGELEIGQIASIIEYNKPAAEILKEIIVEYESLRIEMTGNSFKFDT
ncbi:MAG: nitronate monooxygenase [Ignavibacteriae bacterium]|nr:nitronate monooxygenase [Ignavibacteriota bacterium]